MHCFHPNNLKNKIRAGKLTFISQPESNYIFSRQNYAKLSSLTFQNLISKEIGNLEYKIKLRNFDERINFVLDLPSMGRLLLLLIHYRKNRESSCGRRLLGRSLWFGFLLTGYLGQVSGEKEEGGGRSQTKIEYQPSYREYMEHSAARFVKKWFCLQYMMFPIIIDPNNWQLPTLLKL